MPDYFSDSNSIGAHISVVYPKETKQAVPVSSIGQTYFFSVGSYFQAEILGKRYYGCTVESPELTQLRASLGLKEMLNFKSVLVPFHFTIAVKMVST